MCTWAFEADCKWNLGICTKKETPTEQYGLGVLL